MLIICAIAKLNPRMGTLLQVLMPPCEVGVDTFCMVHGNLANAPGAGVT